MRHAIGFAVLGAVFALGSCICVERPRRMTEEERAKLQQNILREVPANIEHLVNANLDNRLELIGYDLKADKDPQGRILPGRTITVTWYWKCLEPLEDGWQLFTHVADDAGMNRVQADSRGLVRANYPPSAWGQGEIIVDTQDLPLPPDLNSRSITLYVGAWFGPHRLPVVNDAPHDGTGRVKIGPFPVQYDVSSVVVPGSDGTLVLDGVLDDPLWAQAVVLSPFVPAPDGPPAGDRVKARLLWTPDYLYVAFEVQDALLVAQYDQRDDKLYDQDAVDLFLDEGGDGKDYYEFEVSPAGTLFDVALSEPRKGEPEEFNAPGFRAAVKIDGTLNDAQPDRGYVVEMQIPFSALAKFKQRTPREGIAWRANLFVLDTTALPETPGGRAAQEGFAWSAPRKPDFHEFRRFGELQFGAVLPLPPPPPPPPPPLEPPPPGPVELPPLEPATLAPAPEPPAAPAVP